MSSRRIKQGFMLILVLISMLFILPKEKVFAASEFEEETNQQEAETHSDVSGGVYYTKSGWLITLVDENGAPALGSRTCYFGYKGAMYQGSGIKSWGNGSGANAQSPSAQATGTVVNDIAFINTGGVSSWGGDTLACKLEEDDPSTGNQYAHVILESGKKRRPVGAYRYVLEENAKTVAGEREIIIPSEAHWVLRELKKNTADDEYVVRNEDGERINANALRTWYTKLLKKLGLPHKKPHAIRKTYASILLDNGSDKKFTQMQMGHTDVLTTEQYYHRDRRTIQQKQDLLDKMPEFRILGQTEFKQVVND